MLVALAERHGDDGRTGASTRAGRDLACAHAEEPVAVVAWPAEPSSRRFTLTGRDCGIAGVLCDDAGMPVRAGSARGEAGMRALCEG